MLHGDFRVAGCIQALLDAIMQLLAVIRMERRVHTLPRHFHLLIADAIQASSFACQMNGICHIVNLSDREFGNFNSKTHCFFGPQCVFGLFGFSHVCVRTKPAEDLSIVVSNRLTRQEPAVFAVF